MKRSRNGKFANAVIVMRVVYGFCMPILWKFLLFYHTLCITRITVPSPNFWWIIIQKCCISYNFKPQNLQSKLFYPKLKYKYIFSSAQNFINKNLLCKVTQFCLLKFHMIYNVSCISGLYKHCQLKNTDLKLISQTNSPLNSIEEN